MRLTFTVAVPVDLAWLRRMELREGRPASELLAELAQSVENRLHDEVLHQEGVCGRQASIDARLEGEVSQAGIN
jgi:hypothetical protein